MTLYFDTKAQFLEGDAISTVCSWHLKQPLFAVASYTQEHGACVNIFDDSVRDFFSFNRDFCENSEVLMRMCYFFRLFMIRANRYEMSHSRCIQFRKRPLYVGIPNGVLLWLAGKMGN